MMKDNDQHLLWEAYISEGDNWPEPSGPSHRQADIVVPRGHENINPRSFMKQFAEYIDGHDNSNSESVTFHVSIPRPAKKVHLAMREFVGSLVGEGKKWSPLDGDRPKEGTPEGEEYETRHITPGPERERELKRRKEARENKPKEEGAFAGPGGNPDEDGSETYDDPDDPAFNPPSDAQDMRDWLNDKGDERNKPRTKTDAELVDLAHQMGVEEMIVLDGEGLLANREEILKAIDNIDLDRDKAESTAGDWREEDAEFDRETDQDRYGYPGDR